MSLSQPKISNPCKKFIEFKGDEGVFRFWDKDNKQNVIIPFPVKFIVLDQLATIKGFSDSTQSGIYSNEVHSTKNQTLHVRSFKGNMHVTGKYSDIKPQIEAMGGKFCRSVYVALINGKDIELANFQLTGASLKSWMDNAIDLNNKGVSVSKCMDGKKGKVEYKIPVFESLDIDSETFKSAIKLDEVLQEYFKLRKLQDLEAKPEVKEDTQTDKKSDLENDDIPF